MQLNSETIYINGKFCGGELAEVKANELAWFPRLECWFQKWRGQNLSRVAAERLKAVDTIGNCQRLASTVGVSQHINNKPVKIWAQSVIELAR